MCLKKFLSLAAGVVFFPAAVIAQPSGVEQKVDALLQQMTLDEKVGQMTQADMYAISNHLSDIQTYFLGSMLSGGNSDPADNSAQTWLKTVTEYQSWALKTRLKIPLLYGIDAVHGHNNIEGATIFPHHIGLGAMHNPDLVGQAERVTAEEIAGTGINWAFAPCLAVARNERWGRTYESFGQSPELVAELGAAAVRGLQGDQLAPGSILACAKHYMGDGDTKDGKDQGNDVCDEATLRKLALTPYPAAIQAGVGSVMVSYSSWNGQKMSVNKHLLTDVLKGELGFRGFLVSDWAAIDEVHKNYKKDVEESINAGMDMVMIPNGPGKKNNYVEFINDVKALVAEGKVSQARIDDAVRRILRVKIEMGLFEHPSPVTPELTAAIGSPEHREVARQCVQQSLVLLKNENHALPLSKSVKRLAVIGQAADDIGIQCGGWTISWQGAPGDAMPGGTTILAAIRRTVSPGTEVVYSPDGNFVSNVDAAIVVTGEMPYAETVGDRTKLDLPAESIELVQKAKAIGAPVVTILISGRPMILNSALDNSDAFIAAWLPGTEGQGVADVLFGDYKPTGKLPRLWPRNNDQLSVDHVKGEPLFPLGFGLSY